MKQRKGLTIKIQNGHIHNYCVSMYGKIHQNENDSEYYI